MEKVWDGICAAELIIADCTQKNPNVFYEIGMAHTVGKKVVLITRSEGISRPTSSITSTFLMFTIRKAPDS